MQITTETTRTTCDHCGELTDCIILYAEFRGMKNDSIQLCKEHATYFAGVLKDFGGDQP